MNNYIHVFSLVIFYNSFGIRLSLPYSLSNNTLSEVSNGRRFRILIIYSSLPWSNIRSSSLISDRLNLSLVINDIIEKHDYSSNGLLPLYLVIIKYVSMQSRKNSSISEYIYKFSSNTDISSEIFISFVLY